MIKYQTESGLIGELREHLRQLQASAADLARKQTGLSEELGRALQIVLELPQPHAASERMPAEFGTNPPAKAAAAAPDEDRGVGKLRQQLQQMQDLAEELTQQQGDLKTKLNAALQEALELRHSEAAGRTELGGEA